MLLPNPRLPLDTVEQMFDKLKWEEARLVESWSVYDSFNFIVTAHHLWFDWMEHAGSLEQQSRAAELPDDAKMIFQAVVDVSNGTKHWVMNRPDSKKRQVVAEVTDPICAGYDSYFFGDMIHFKFDEYFVSMSEISALIMGFFEWIIYGTGEKSVDELSAAMSAMKVGAST
jgi:hypothetical protein